MLGKFFPFYVTANEVRCSDDIPEQYHLFRVFNMGREPQIYILHGSLKILCQLEPILFPGGDLKSQQIFKKCSFFKIVGSQLGAVEMV